MNRKLFPIALVHGLIFLSFFIYYMLNFNVEFLIYIIIILGLTFLIYFSDKRIHYSSGVLWALVLWGLLHMAGGSVPVGEGVLYQWIILPLSENYPILRFDQVVHAFGFGTCVFLIRDLIKKDLKQNTVTHRFGLGLVLVMGAMGLGALNEGIEFTATAFSPNNGVGGYVNNAPDLVFNFVGALVAVGVLWEKEKDGKF